MASASALQLGSTRWCTQTQQMLARCTFGDSETCHACLSLPFTAGLCVPAEHPQHACTGQLARWAPWRLAVEGGDMKKTLAVPLATGLMLSTGAAEAGPACQQNCVFILKEWVVSRGSFCCCDVDYCAPLLPYARRPCPFTIYVFLDSNQGI